MTPDVIVSSSDLVTEIVQQETRTIPVVFVFVGDPVGSGFVTNVAHPGGNLTGFPVFETAIAGKWVEIFHEVAPHVGRVAFIMVPETSAHVGFLRAAEAAATPLRDQVIALAVHTAAEIERAVSFRCGAQRRPDCRATCCHRCTPQCHPRIGNKVSPSCALSPYVTLPRVAA